jgi:hypothetical protein
MKKSTPVTILISLHHAYNVVGASHQHPYTPVSPRYAVGISGLDNPQNVLWRTEARRMA